MTESQVQEIFRKFDVSLKSIFENPGGPLPTFDGRASTQPLQINSRTSSDIPNAEFEWGSEGRTIRGAISRLAGLDEAEVTEDSSIFELGLDSIEAIKLSARLRQHDIQISVSTIMRNPTIRKLCVALKQTSSPSTSTVGDLLSSFDKEVRKKILTEDIEAIYPATPLQEGMIAETINSDYHFYFNHEISQIRDHVDVRRLCEAWEKVVLLNPILRTTFFSTHELGIGSPYTFGQLVHSNAALTWFEVSATDAELHNVQRQVMAQAKVNANLLKKPPLSITVIKTPVSRFMILSISHALYDGQSLDMLHQDVMKAYNSSLKPRPPYKKLIENIIGTDLKESINFWKQRLDRVNISEFPGPVNGETIGNHRAEYKSTITFSKAQQFCKSQGVTLQTLGQTCWGLALAHYMKRADVVFGTVLSGRDIPQGDEMMFPAMNTVPVRAIVHGTYKDMLSYMQDSMGYVLKYQHTPLRVVQKALGVGGRKLFDTLFIYQRGQGELGEEMPYTTVTGSSDIEVSITTPSYDDNEIIFS